MNYTLRHTTCDRDLFTLQLDGPLRSLDEIADEGARRIDDDLHNKKGLSITREWPLECDECGVALTFEPILETGGARRPKLSKIKGSIVYHD
jgi:hypothetical protein